MLALVFAKHLDQHRVIEIAAKGTFDGLKVHLVTVTRELHASSTIVFVRL